MLQHVFKTVIVTSCMVGLGLMSAHAQTTPNTAGAQTTPSTAGEYIFNLSGCEGCHTDKKNGGARLAGGRAFKTDFGTFYTPNITPERDTGIGTWTFENFKAALRHGEAPDGTSYFPSFPYTSYTHMTDPDLRDLWTYIQAQPAVTSPNLDHDLRPPFGWRWLMPVWNWLYLETGPQTAWSRGKYIATALSHCHECHTPRTLLGGYDLGKPYGGTLRNPEGIAVPNITPHRQTGIGKWTDSDFEMLLTIGMLPDADFVGGVMAESITHSTSRMTDTDRAALITYLRSLQPVENSVSVEKQDENDGEDW